jgi:NH3-dependent NAD+ synthetase
MKVLGIASNEIDIKPSCMQMSRDIGPAYAGGAPVYDVTFENVQAGERRSHLFRLSNFHMLPRWDQAAHFHPAVTGEHPAILKLLIVIMLCLFSTANFLL